MNYSVTETYEPNQVDIKSVKDIKHSIDNFINKLDAINDIDVIYSDAWHPFPKYDEAADSLFKMGGKTGIYVYSKPLQPWAVPFYENDSEIWYIGMSQDYSVRGRCWSHLEPIKNKEKINLNGEWIKPQFGVGDWGQRSHIPVTIRNAVKMGNFTAYGIRIDAFSEYNGMARQLENYLLQCYLSANDRLPYFNAKL